ncbi:MAG: hypothetical protein DWQ49_12140, partial [Bacteroidetes bacterium]
MALRSINTALKTALLQEDPFVYAHLVKFERPITMDGDKPRQDAEDFIYITDASRDVSFDDSSTNVDGTANGSQVYVANKLRKSGSVSETVQARATSFSIQVDSTALDISASGLTVAIADTSTPRTLEITSNGGHGDDESCSWTGLGFREGDIVEIERASWNDGVLIRIDKFVENNTKIHYTLIKGPVTNRTGSASGVTVYQKNPEIEGIISDRSESGYARYINRDVFVYKAFINPETGAIIGAPYLLFKGIIAGGKISEDPMKGSFVTWNITSHWGDFSRVSGRLTSDAHHRALDQNNNPDINALIRPEYATDLGFLHSEQAVNLVAIYQVKETRQKMKMKRKWYGSKKYKLIEYEVEVDREADLRFNLQAKYLPVIYGVNKIDSIPVFVDTLNTDAKQVYVAYAICEGQIGGIYDVYFDDTSSVCIDENDKDTRSTQTDENTIDVLCSGRMDRGDVIQAQTVNSTTSRRGPGHSRGWGNAGWTDGLRDRNELWTYSEPYFDPLVDSSIGSGTHQSAAGITHEKGTKFTTPIDSILTFHAGKPDQRANSTLVSNASNFKIATDYYTGSQDYWGAQHRLLDTAYCVVKYTIGEGETTIPSLDFVVRGKGVACDNYDFSYASDPAYSSDDVTVFDLGEEVEIKDTGTDTSLGSVVIQDIYTITNMDGDSETRVRFGSNPDSLGTGSFYMTDGSNNYHMVSSDHKAHSGTIPGALQEEITSVSSTSVSGGTGTDITVASGSPSAAWASFINSSENIALTREILAETGFVPEMAHIFYSEETYGNDGVVQNIGETSTGSSVLVGEYVTIMDAVRLASGASGTDDAYNNYFIKFKIHSEDGSITEETRTIIDYDGTNKVAKLNSALSIAPAANDTYEIYPGLSDVRVTTNPAMQLLDYLTSPRYGRGLDRDKDIDLPSFYAAARQCDTRSNVNILIKNSTAPTVGEEYKYPSSGKVLFHAKVKSATSVTISSEQYWDVEFEEVKGKLAHRWANWKYFYDGELYYNDGVLHEAPSDGVISSYSSSANTKASVSLTRASGSGPSSLPIDINTGRKTADGDPIVKKYNATTDSTNSGYELYDADDVKYWRYLGWEAQNQRHVTRHQTNTTLDTASPIFDNINSMLKHFNGILRYASGKYSLAVESTASAAETFTSGGVTYKPDTIEEGDIIGAIAVEDAGQKGTFNQVDVSIDDPQNRFEGRSVMMFNSNYLKEDRMVPKKGNFQAPYVTNYYNARINAKQYLDQSRSGIKISFTMGPKGLLLLAGEVIRINYPRFGWTNKLYRIINLSFKEDCLVQVTAMEHDDNSYIVESPNRGTVGGNEGIGGNPAALSPPTSLSATTDKFGGVELSWTDSANFKPSTYSTEVYASDTNDRSAAVLLDTTKAAVFTDPIVEGGTVSKYYWVRHIALVPPQTGSQVGLKRITSPFEPLSATGGVLGTSGDIRSQTVNLSFSQGVIVYAADGTTPDVSTITLTADVQGFDDPYFKFTGGGSDFTDETTWTDGSSDTQDTATFTVPTTYSATPYTFTVEVKEGGASGDVLASDKGSVASIKPGLAGADATDGAAGTDARVVNLTMGDQSFDYTVDGDSPSPTSTTVTATARNTDSQATVYYEFFLNDTSQQNTTSNTYTYTPQASHSNMPDKIEVQIREGSSSSTVLARDQITAFGLKPAQDGDDGDDGVDALTVILSNATHAIPEDENGDLDFTGSGTTIQLWEGTTQLTYDGVGTSNSSWKIDTTNTTVTNVTQAGSPYTDSGAYVTVADLTAFASGENTGSISYRISGKRADGTAISIDAVQSFVRTIDGLGAISVYLDNPSHVVNASSSGTVADFGSAGTTISVFEGGTQLDYDGSGTTDGHWTVSAAGTNITPDTITEDGDNAVSGDSVSNMTADNAKIVYTITGKRLNGEAISETAQQSFSKSRNGSNGTDGLDGRTVVLKASTYVVDYAADGSTPGVSSITLTADSFNFTDAYFKFTGGGSAFTDETSWTDGTGANQDTATFTVPTTYSATPYEFLVEVKEGGTGNVIASDSLSISSLKPGSDGDDGDDGVDALTLLLTNPAHTIPVGTDGTLSYTDSGTQIQLFEGTTALDYDGSGTTDGHWTVSASATNITAGSISDSNNFAVVGNASNMTDDVASVTYTITGKRLNGDAISLSIKQSFSKANRGASGTDAKVVSLRASNQVISYDADGLNPTPSGNITLTADSQNFSNAYFKFTGGGSAFTDETSWTDGSAQNQDTATFAIPTNYSATPYTFTVSVKEGGTGDVIATDTITIASVQPGTDGDDGDAGVDALTVILSNENHAIPETNAGVRDFTGSGTTIRLFEGTTELDYDGSGTTDGHWTVADPTDTNVTSAASPFTENGNQVTVSAITAISAATGNRTFTITGKRLDGTAISLDKVQTFVKTVDGDDGDDGVDGVSLNMTATQVVFNKDSGGNYDPANTSTISLSAFGGTITSVTYTDNRSYLSTSSTSNSGCTATFSANRTKAQVEQANTVTAAVTGTTSDGTTGVSFGSITVDIPTVINGSDGGDGADALRTVHGYLYYEKTSAGAPSAPSGNSYSFANGTVSGSGIGTGTNVWTNEPRTQDPTSSNTQYIVRYYGTEASAGASTVTVSYSSVAQHTNFTSVVTFSGGTFQDGGSNITNIDGGNIQTGSIAATSLTIGNTSIG